MEKKFKLFLIVGLSLLFAQGAFSLILNFSKGKTAYIKTEEVYNNFGLKKKLEAELKKTQQARQGLLDSLKFQLDMMSVQLQQKKNNADSSMLSLFADLRDTYFKKQEEFRQSNDALAQQYTSQIWSQLNQYLQDYGHKKGYQYIFGASGDGTLMFADDGDNITDDVKTYVNDRFKGQP